MDADSHSTDDIRTHVRTLQEDYIMNLPDRLALSFYTTIAPLCKSHDIYLVRHQETGKLFVKKIIDIYSPDIYEYLRYHPIQGVPRIIASCEEDGRLTIIEEYISGCTLRDKIEATKEASRIYRLARSGQTDAAASKAIPETYEAAGSKAAWPPYELPDDCLTVSLIGRYMIQLCEILERLHSLAPPMIHRDIKPSNIMITAHHNVVLMDFNAARYYSGSAERESDTRLLGTHGYAAPEQYGFRESMPQTDLYSVGRILQEAVDSLPSEDHTFDAVIAKCTQMDPSRRYASAGALKAAIRKNLARYHRMDSSDPAANPHLPPGYGTRGFLLLRTPGPALMNAFVAVILFILFILLIFIVGV